MRILLKNASEVVVASSSKDKLDPEESRNLEVIKNCSIMLNERRIEEINVNHGSLDSDKVIDASGCTILPGFIDPHTHMIFAGSRTDEFYSRIAGESYYKVLERGGGITRTAMDTQNATAEELFQQSMARVRDSLMHGTTTIEMKTGYSNDLSGEKKMIEAMERIKSTRMVDVVKTFLGLHFTPRGIGSREYVETVISDYLPAVAKKMDFADVFCDSGAFDIDDSYNFLSSAKKQGLKLKAHADEIANIGALAKLSELNLVSADHLLKSRTDQLELLAKSGGTGIVLPITSYLLDPNDMPGMSKFEDAALPVAIGTDCSPATYSPDMLFAIYLSVRFCGFTIEQAINGATVNAASALSLKNKGTIAVGSDADLIVLNTQSYEDIPYKFGSNLVRDVIHSGKLLMQNGTMIQAIHNSGAHS